jgi:predicted transcriptional regulator
MSEQLAKAFGEAQRLTDGDQDDLAEFIRAFVLARTAVEPDDLTIEEQACVDAGMAQAERGEFISDEAAEVLLRKPWK